jgi:hypothetical protein
VDKAAGVYGRCQRSEESGLLVYKVIPRTARVERCFYKIMARRAGKEEKR